MIFTLRSQKSGFTLIEVLVVIGIIGLLSTLGRAAFGYARNSAKITKVGADTEQIAKAMRILSNDTLLWPGGLPIDAVGTAEGVEICSSTPNCAYDMSSPAAGLVATDGSYLGWSGPYMSSIPKDPWGNQYFFDPYYEIQPDGTPCDGESICAPAAVLGSYGPNGVGNNDYDEDDIIKILAK